MADFIAVIRRAVDGLSNNTPEMRTKVYDKARGAVLRQLENMSPRPPEDMIRRQMDKLESAIREVETEHAEALPAAEEPVVLVYDEPAAPPSEPVEPQDYAAPEPAQPAIYEPVEVEAQSRRDMPLEPPPIVARDTEMPVRPATPAVVYQDYTSDQPVSHEEPVEQPHAYEPPAHAEPEYSGPEHAEPVAPVEYEQVPARHEDVHYEEVQHGEGLHADDRRHEAVVEEYAYHPPEPEPEPEPAYTAPEPVYVAPEPVELPPVVPEPVIPRIEPPAPPLEEPRAEIRPGYRDYGSEPEIASARTESEYEAWREMSPPDHAVDEFAAAQMERLQGWADEPPARPAPAKAEPFVEPESRPRASERKPDDGRSPQMPPALDLLDWQQELSSLPSFDTPPSKVSAGAKAAAAKPAAKPQDFSADIDEFLAAAQEKAYRIEPKRRRNFLPLILSFVGVLLLAGGGYAIWTNFGAMSDMVSGLVSSAAKIAPQQQANNPPQNTPPAPTSTPATPAQPPAANNRPREEGVATGQKFTQRLMADGSEVDDGVSAVAPTGNGGQSVSQQNVAPAQVPAQAAPGQTPGHTPGQTPPGAPAAQAPETVAPPAPAPGVAPVQTGDGPRAFLYEERLGQTSPATVLGNITWTLLHESGANGRQEPAIQGRLNIAERGMTALITFRRNNDNSLPASHLVEIVFSLPPEFEGGAVESVQRVSMKRTEQDRGDQLVGVGAKVTDDTFLIALNDFQDVIARNIDLLGTRSWIDIPLTYRNGRRALLTLDKGAQGNQLFQQAIREWAALRTNTGG